MSDANKKTARSFQCRDALWEKFEQMARELECSIDYLINDSMKQYLRQRGYGTAASMSVAPGPAGAGAPPPLPSPPGMPPLPPARSSVGPPPPPAGARGAGAAVESGQSHQCRHAGDAVGTLDAVGPCGVFGPLISMFQSPG